MGDDSTEVFKEDFSLLIEAGFVAVKQLDETSASRIFKAAQAISPNSVAPQIGLGYIALNKLEIKEATRIYEEVLEKEPENHLAQAFLGICFLLTKPKRKKGEKLIRDIIGKTTNPTIKNLCEISLEWADKDLTKKESPFLAAKPGNSGQAAENQDSTS
jgi:lipopolysaccharide biosynthesis regulator YciM